MAEKRKYGKKFCKYTEMKVDYIDYKNTDLFVITSYSIHYTKLYDDTL